MKRCNTWCLVLIVLLIVGCGQAVYEPAESRSNNAGNGDLGQDSHTEQIADLSASRPAASVAKQNRRIIYTTDISLIVDSLTSFDLQLTGLVSEYGGYLSRVNFNNLHRKNKSGTWTARIPVARHEDFLVAAGKLGLVDSKHQKAEDVSDEFVDLESRIKNKQLLEDRIAKLIDSYSKSLPEMIKVEYELSRVREEIERMQGRLNYLKNKTGLATVSFKCREKESPVAPILVAAVPFKTQISEAWGTAVAEIANLFQCVVIFFARYSLMLLTVALGTFVVWLVLRPLAARIWKVIRLAG